MPDYLTLYSFKPLSLIEALARYICIISSIRYKMNFAVLYNYICKNFQIKYCNRVICQ